MPGSRALNVGADVFLDTNVLIYAAQGKTAAPEQFAVARRIVLEENFGTSAQVLSEFYANVTRKGARPLTPDVAATWVRLIARQPCQSLDARLVASGIELHRRFNISYWDGAILAAAERLGQGKQFAPLQHSTRFGQSAFDDRREDPAAIVHLLFRQRILRMRLEPRIDHAIDRRMFFQPSRQLHRSRAVRAHAQMQRFQSPHRKK